MYCNKPKKYKCEYYDKSYDLTHRCRMTGGCKFALSCIGNKCKEYYLQGTTREGYKYCHCWMFERCYVIDNLIKELNSGNKRN
jgi:hypothetical protein